MTMKSVLAGIPIGGAKGGVRSDPKIIDTETLLAAASRLTGRYIRKQSYFLGTDIGFNEKYANQVYALAGSRRRIFSGKLSPGACCAHSVLASIDYVKRANPKIRAETVALEGFGAMAMPTAKLLTSEGYRIVAISNIQGTLEDASGLDIKELTETAGQPNENLLPLYARDHPTATFQSDNSINLKNCDILIPGARVFSIHETTATQLKSKLICPIANSPITAAAEEILASRGVISIPDVISNSGALIGSFAQQLGANQAQTERIIADLIHSNLPLILDPVRGRIPKLVARDIATQRMGSLERSEKLTALQWLTPWIREFGSDSFLRALRLYLTLKINSAIP